MSGQKSKLQEMQSRLKVEDLSPAERDALFKDLQKAGGKIVELTEEDNPYNQFKKKSQAYKEITGSDRPPSNNEKARLKKNDGDEKVGGHDIRPSADSANPFRAVNVVTKPKTPQKSQNQTMQLRHETSKKIGTPGDLFLLWIRFNCFIGGLTRWSGKTFTKSFTRRMTVTNRDQIIKIKSILDPLFREPTPENLNFRKKLGKENRLIDLELAYHAYNLFDLQDFSKLQREMSRSVLESEKTLKNIFTTLYLFNRHQTQLKVSTAGILRRFRELYPDVCPPNADRVFDGIWDLLVVPMYFDLEQMMELYMNQANVLQKTLLYKTMDDYLQTADKDVEVGNLAREWREQDRYQAEKLKEAMDTEAEADPSAIYPNEQIQQDAEFLFECLDYPKLLESFKKSSDFRVHFTPDDKLFYTYVILDFFDKEFSSLWVGDLIQYYTVADGTSVGRFDSRKEVVALNHKLNGAHEWVNDYLRRKDQTQKMIARTPDQKSMLVQQHLKELSRSSFTVRQNLQTILYDFTQLIGRLVRSIDENNPLIGGTDQEIVLQKSFSDRIINGMTGKDALIKAHNLMAALLWMLKYGDLSGLSANMVGEIKFKGMNS
ncbi:MAG: hypothetical protein ACRCS8_04160 [Brevinema sp.]